MLMPSIFRDNLIDDFWERPFCGYRPDSANEIMKTDVKETDHDYQMTMNLPGIRKEDVTAELKDGYLIVRARTDSEKEEKAGDGRYIRRERYSGSCSRSFYVGEEVTQEDIKARFEDGTLKLVIPKKEEKPVVEDSRRISIEG